MTGEIEKQREMSDSVGGGESGGVTGSGQDTEADNEPPQQMPPLPEAECAQRGEIPEEEAPTSAKRPRLTEDLGQVTEPLEIHSNTAPLAGLLQGDPASPAQGGVYTIISCDDTCIL